MTTALVTLTDMERMAEAVARSGLFGMKTPDQALALMLTAQAEGQHPATITQDYDIIQGRAARKTHSVMARFQAAGGTVQWHTLTDDIADATFSHPSGGSVRIDWTIQRAMTAKLTGKDNWKSYPRAMLRARCIAEGIRTVWPAAIGGYLVTEEAQDVVPEAPMFERDITPPAEPATKTAAVAQALKGVKLDDVLKAYQAATTPEAIKSIDTQAAKLASEADKAIARQVRTDRLAKLKAEQAAEAPAKLFAEYEADMRAAETQEARDAVLAGAILNEEQFKDLEALWLELKTAT